jgi:hypothetical protein
MLSDWYGAFTRKAAHVTRGREQNKHRLLEKSYHLLNLDSTRSEKITPIMNYPKMMYGPNTQKIQHSKRLV